MSKTDAMRERAKVKRETLGKFYYDLAKLVFAGVVISEFINLHQRGIDVTGCVIMASGLLMTALLAVIGNNVLK